MSEPYRHTQIGYITLFFLGGGIVMCFAISAMTYWHPIAVGVGVLLILASILFGALTVEVRADTVECRFGPGLIRKRWQLNDIQKVEVVRNAWYYGWGIRLIPGGWLYNVSGLDAVEITLRSGKRYRIGTDEPSALKTAIVQNAGLTT
jgi:hypothetical protein